MKFNSNHPWLIGIGSGIIGCIVGGIIAGIIINSIYSTNTNLPLKRITSYCDQADSLSKMKLYQEAILVYDDMLKELESHNEKNDLNHRCINGKAICLMYLAERSSKPELLVQSRLLLEELLNNTSPKTDIKLYLQTLYCLSIVYLTSSKIRDRVFYLSTAYKLLLSAQKEIDFEKYEEEKSDIQFIFADILLEIGTTDNSKIAFIDSSITIYKKILEHTNQDLHMKSYSIVQIHLGKAYYDYAKLISGPRTFIISDTGPNTIVIDDKMIIDDDQVEEYLKLSIQYFIEASHYFTFERDASSYAALQNSLGITYEFLADYVDPTYHFEKAIMSLKNANNVYQKDSTDHTYTMTLHNLGVAYTKYGITKKNCFFVKKSINILKKVLDLINKNDYPLDYAMAAVQLGFAFSTLAEHEDKGANCKCSIHYWNEAKTIFTYDNYPHEYASIQQQLNRVQNMLQNK